MFIVTLLFTFLPKETQTIGANFVVANDLQILESYSKKDERIKIVDKENGGLSDARNHGLNIAKGEYIGFVDCDDIIPLEYFERLYNKAIETNAIVAKCSRATLYEDGKVETRVAYEVSIASMEVVNEEETEEQVEENV